MPINNEIWLIADPRTSPFQSRNLISVISPTQPSKQVQGKAVHYLLSSLFPCSNVVNKRKNKFLLRTHYLLNIVVKSSNHRWVPEGGGGSVLKYKEDRKICNWKNQYKVTLFSLLRGHCFIRNRVLPFSSRQKVQCILTKIFANESLFLGF